MRTSLIVLAVLVAIGYKLLYSPVPKELDEKIKFRAFLAVASFARFVCTVFGQFTGKPGLQILNELAMAVMPHPPSTVEGSNIRSEFTTFDGVRVLLYEPIRRKSEKPVAGLMFYHGGGYILGSPELYEGLTRKIAEDLDIVVVSVDYCLSTRRPFPAAHEDAMTALRYFLTHASEFGVDPTRIGVSGDSAGGHLAAAIAQEASDDPALPRLKIQVLLYPLLQLLDLSTPSYQQHRHDFGVEGGMLPRSMSNVFRSYLLFGRYDEEFINAMNVNNHTSLAFKQSKLVYYNHDLIPEFYKKHVSYKGPLMDGGDSAIWNKYKHLLNDVRLSPLMREDLSGLPPAYVLSCQFDGLRDDAIMYVARLKKAGVKVHSLNYYNGWHGMINMQMFYAGERSLRLVIAHLKEHL